MKNQNLLAGDIFIIPNPSFKTLDESFKLPSFMMDINTIFYQNEDLNTNNVKIEDTRFIECWFCNPENDNWRDHGIKNLERGFEDDEYWRLSSSYVPDWIFNGHKEGDVVTFKMPVERRCRKRCVLERAIVTLSVTLAQNKYRYRGFGNFEEVLKRV